MATVAEVLDDVYGNEWRKYQATQHYLGNEVFIMPAVSRRQTLDRCALNESNARVLDRDWSLEPAVTWVNHVFCDSLGLILDEEAPETLAETLEALEMYPVLDDEEFTNVEDEWIGEYVENWMFDEVVRYLDDESLHDTTAVLEAWYKYQEMGLEWHLEYDHLIYDAEVVASLVTPV